MQDEDMEDAIAAARRQLDEALAAAVPAATPVAGDVHVHGGTAINVGNVSIGSQTIHYPPQPKGRS